VKLRTTVLKSEGFYIGIGDAMEWRRWQTEVRPYLWRSKFTTYPQ
jgi:hypothetical protein